MIPYKTEWSEIVSKYLIDASLSENIFNDLVKNYSSKKRHYHTLEHIQNMLNSISEVKNRLADYETVFFAVWFHDVIYESLKNDNEDKSALYASKALIKINFTADRITKVCQLILATKNHTIISANEDFDTQLMLDADLKILGASKTDYFKYTQQVRKEYKLVPELLYKPGRKKVLSKFLEMPFLFRTPEYRERYEIIAKENLRNELELL